MIDASFGGFSPLVTEMFSGPGWGWHIETAVHVLRMVLGGVFDRFPESADRHRPSRRRASPAMFQRVDIMAPAVTKLKRPVGAYLRENIHYTFSGFNFTPTFLDSAARRAASTASCSRSTIPTSRWPRARAFLDQLPVSPEDKERIAHGNAEKLFKL